MQRAPLFVEQVGDVRERGAGPQAGRLRRGGRRRRRRLRPPPAAGRAGRVAPDGAGSPRPTSAPPSSSRRRPAAERPLAARSSRSSRLPAASTSSSAARWRGPSRGGVSGAPAQRAARRRDADDVHAVGHAQPALAPVALRVRGERRRLEPEPGQLARAGSPRPPRPRAPASVSSYWRSILSAPVGGHTSASAAENDVR